MAALLALIGVPVIFGTPILLQRWRRPRCMAIIYTRTHAEAPTWIQRNRDALITNVIVSAIFLLVGILVGAAT